VETASQQRDDAQNERIDAVEYGLTAVANGADKSFTTYAQMIAYVPPESNVSVRNNDPDLTLRGTYTWTGSQYVKGYDPLDAANTYTDQKVQAETTRI
ncbi:exo-alpha-sialidase, partial [Acinetobacter baumannii]|nr:exo-alpha-sialidase [Acinetobacter baumannii]